MADGVFTAASRKVLTSAFTSARGFSHSCLCSEHLLLGLFADEQVGHGLDMCGLSRDDVERAILETCGRGEAGCYTASVSREAADILEAAARIAAETHSEGISPRHMLMAMLEDTGCSAFRLICRLGAEPSEIMTGAAGPHMRDGSRRARVREPKLLMQFGTDMTAKASKGEYDRLVGRDDELRRIVRILCRRRKANPVLLGEAGVGKTAVVEGLAGRIVSGLIPSLRGCRIFSLDMANVVAGTKYRGEFEEKLRHILDEAAACGDIILFIDELHTVAGAGAAEGAIDAGNILKPALARGELRLIGATTPSEYRRHIACDAALERRFQPVDICEPSKELTMSILRSAAVSCRRWYGISADEDILELIEHMGRRYLPMRRFPDKAVDILDEASALAVTEGRNALTSDHIRRVTAQMSGLETLLSGEQITSEQLRTRIMEGMVGQEKAVEAAVSAVSAAMAFPSGRGRPQGAMLFCGESGTGKSHLARQLAYALFGDEKALVRFDMSEYREAHSVSRLIGAPPGYVGHDRGGLLTEAVRRRPFCVLLFDEAEKAHPEVLTLLLQLLEEGELTDSDGVKADFRSAIVILTSNVGSRGEGRAAGFGTRDGGRLIKALEGRFPPELLGRIDSVISFEPLSEAELVEIAIRELSELSHRTEAEGVFISYSDDVAGEIARRAGSGRGVRSQVVGLIEQPAALICLGHKRPVSLRAEVADGSISLSVDENVAV